jgi:hypothetical protein
MARNVAAAVSALALALALAGCGGSDEAAAGTPAGAIIPGTTALVPVPAPSGRPVLTINGAVSNHNEGDAVAFDLPALDAMATVTTRIHEPFVQKDLTFTGVPMITLVTRAGIATTATTLRLHALDDYKVELTVADIADPGVLLATKVDGTRIPVSAGGPIRLIFPPGSALGRNKDMWIWSIDSITVG